MRLLSPRRLSSSAHCPSPSPTVSVPLPPSLSVLLPVPPSFACAWLPEEGFRLPLLRHHRPPLVGTTVGLFLPLAYVLGGFGRGDEHAVRCASPHLFLVSFQILTENIISSLPMFSPPVRALVPLMYTVRRIFVDIDWMHNVWLNKTLPANPHLKEKAWFWFGRVLAVANLVYYSINLFGFLIPRFLPRAFKRYFQERGEIYAKEVEDKRYVVINKSYPTVKKSD